MPPSRRLSFTFDSENSGRCSSSLRRESSLLRKHGGQSSSCAQITSDSTTVKGCEPMKFRTWLVLVLSSLFSIVCAVSRFISVNVEQFVAVNRLRR